MSQYSFRIRATHGANIGEIVAWIPNEAWLYFNAVRRVNDVGFCEGIISESHWRELVPFFNVDDGGILDYILEITRQPRDPVGGRIAARPEVFAAYIIRYARREHLNDGRPRMTIIGKSLLSIMDRPIIYPDNVLPHTVDLSATAIADAVAAFPWPTPAVEFFTGAAAPADTKTQMEAIVTQCIATNPTALNPAWFTLFPEVAAGIPDHRIQARYDNPLALLQKMSGASWYAWFYGLSGTTLPADFDVTINVATSPQQTLPLQFRVFPGGRGDDRRIGNTVGNQPIVFSATLDNVVQPVYIQDRRNEITRYIVAGQGTGIARDTIAVENPSHYTATHSPYNLIEKYGAASKSPAFPAGIPHIIENYGWSFLRDKGFAYDVSMQPRQSNGVILDLDYFFGDLVTLAFVDPKTGTEELLDRQVAVIDLKLFNHRAGKTGGAAGTHEQITVEFRSMDGRYFEGDKNLVKVLEIIQDNVDDLSDEVDDIDQSN